MCFGEAMVGGLEVHNFTSNVSLRTTTPYKKEIEKDADSTNGMTRAEPVETVQGITIAVIIKFKANNDLEEEEDADLFLYRP